jgi:L-rhamnose mutarotase
MNTQQFRRFTYFLTTDNSKLSAEIASDSFEELRQTTGIHELNVYQKKNEYFIIIDADVSLNSKKLLNLLQKNEEFTLIKNILPKHENALERIYKLDQKESYSPSEGQLKTSVQPYKRFVWTLLLEPNLIDEYKRVHSIGMAWPEITANMKSIGVKDMEIYLHQEKVMLIMDTIPDFDLEAIGPKWQKLPREKEWQKHVAKFQKTDPESSIQEKWQDMKPIVSS